MLGQVDQSFEALLQRAKAGDTEALGQLLETYGAYLRLIAASLLRNASRTSVDVSDVMQETKLKACHNFATFRGNDERQLVAWLRRILVNHALNLLKAQAAPGQCTKSLEFLLESASEEAHRALACTASTPSAQAARREQAVLTANAMEALEPDYRQVLVWFYLEKLKHREIGQRLGRTEGASRMLLMRAAEALEQRLREEP